ncbi:lipase domain protein [Perkinsela sp. CCAP 1560/4]|nr:lipase domain protein [Perkinsela sp. CCAP 1560/4]|eukprot:KNH06342.1 lipase domain protein [Perkinsela sp. CCAP 1560/4]
MSDSSQKVHKKCPSEADSCAAYTLLDDYNHRNRMEIALETVSPWTLRTILTIWYGVLIFGLLMIRLDLHMQWDCVDFHSGNGCRIGEITMQSIRFDESADSALTVVSGVDRIMRSRWNRFPHLLLQVSDPQRQSNRTGDGTLVKFEKNETSKPSKESFSFPLGMEVHLLGHRFAESQCVPSPVEFHKTITRPIACTDGQCEPVLLPIDVPGDVIVEAFDVKISPEESQLDISSLAASIGILYQKRSYTLLGIAMRYTLLVLSALNLLHFFSKLGLQCLLPGRSKKVLVEQIWVIILQAFFLFYANPFHLGCVLHGGKSSARNGLLQFIEFHIADYFTYVVLTWNLVLVNCARFIPRRLPTITHVCCASGLLVMIIFDCVLVQISGSPWSQTVHDFELAFVECSWPTRYVLFLLLALQYAYFVIGFLLAVRLYFKLYKAPYFETRTQQLSFRLFVFVMWLHYVYRIIQSVALHGGNRMSSLLSYHRSHQMSELLIAFVYTQIATFCYSPARHNENTPPPPTSSLWKRVVWSDAWYEWLRRHGGTLYFFNTRGEEEKFHKIQAIARPDGGAESTRGRPVLFMERLIRKLARRFTSLIRMNNTGMEAQRGFFCLEKAVECFNISWEVYFKLPMDASRVISVTPTSRTGADGGASKGQSNSTPNSSPIATPRFFADIEFPLRAAGETTESREMDTEQYGFRLWKAFLIEDVQAVICEDDRTIIIAFRGTSNRQNIKYDMKFSRSNIGVGTKNFLLDLFFVPCVHSGFNTLWKMIEEELLAEIHELCQPRHTGHSILSSLSPHAFRSKPEPWRTPRDGTHTRPGALRGKRTLRAQSGKGKEIIITGHSLGGAIANLCAHSIASRFQVSPTVYTFGSPRIGNTQFRRLYDELVPNTFRIVNQSDIVSRFNIMMDNPHVGCEIAIDRHGNIICHPTFIERILRPWSSGIGLRHHLLGAYGQSLDAVSERHGSSMRVFMKKETS